MKKLLLLGLVLLGVFDLYAKTVGIWVDARSGNLSGATNSLAKAGWTVSILQNNDLENEARLAAMDVLYLPGGWGAYFFPSPAARRAIVRFAAGGKGVLSGGFRSGYVRTANRPMFPEIGCTHNRVNGAWISAVGNSPLASAFKGETLPFGGHDHLVLKAGSNGTPFAQSGEDLSGLYGDYYCGRVIVFGGHFAYKPTDETRDDMERILLSQVDWLASAPRPVPAKAAKAVADAESALIRREFLWTWTADERGPDRQPGHIPGLRDEIMAEPDALRFRLEHYAKFLDANDAQRCRVVAGELKRMTDNVRKTADKLMSDIKQFLENTDLAGLALSCAVNNSLFSEKDIAAKLRRNIPKPRIEEMLKVADEMRVKAAAAKAAALDREHAADLEHVPALLADLALPDAAKRLEAALELGRIEPPAESGAVAALVKTLADSEEKVRTQAAISLGWMRAEGAVDALTSRLKSGCKWDRRRAIQSLGQIGEPRAAAAIRPFVDSKDNEERILAILALGWLKDTDSVPKFLKLASVTNQADRLVTIAAAQALGDIGSKDARETLAALGAASTDLPRDRRGNLLVNNLSGAQRRGLKGTCARAVARIDAGGRVGRGVKQLREYRGRDLFYAVTKRNNAFAGRTETVKGAFPDAGQKLLWPHLADAGFTGVHNAWGWPLMDPALFSDLVKAAGDMDLIWIDTLPGWGGAGILPDAEAVLDHFADAPAFHGFWSEETWPEFGLTADEFEAYLVGKYGKDYRKTCGLRADEDIRTIKGRNWWGPGESDEKQPFKAPYDGFLHTESICAAGERLGELWKESQDFLHGRRKGCAFTYSLSTADPYKVIGGMRAIGELDTFGPESYQSFGRGNAFFMQKLRDGEARPAMAEFYNWYCPSPAHALRGFWQNAIHGKCFYNFALHHIFGQASWYDLWSWDPARWEKAKEVFGRVRANEEFYAVSPSAANVAVMGSERSSVGFKEQLYYQISILVRADQNLLATWTALSQSQIHADIVFAETATAAKLAKYDVIYLTGAKLLTDEEGNIIRDWVTAGGTLIAEGTTSLFHESKLKPLANYRLADLFGADFADAVWPAPEANDTFATRHASPVSAFPVHTGFESFIHFDDYVHRDVKPVKSILRGKLAADLPGLAAGAPLEYDGGLGYDRVKVTSGRVLATYANGDPALVENVFGKGRCYFQTAAYPMLGHVTSRWEMMPNKFDFWPNVRELAVALVKSGLAAKGVALPVEVTGVSKEVEVTVDAQPGRLVVHLLDYDVASDKVEGAKLFVPGSRPIRRVFCPGANANGSLSVKDRTVALRPFSVYDLIVIEFAD